MFTLLILLHVVSAVLLVLVVLVQSGRGAELGAAFGSLGQATFSRGPATVMTRFTTILAMVFMFTSLSLAFLYRETPTRSVLGPDFLPETPSATEAPVSPETPAAPAPADN